jgi:hypothetical protein
VRSGMPYINCIELMSQVGAIEGAPKILSVSVKVTRQEEEGHTLSSIVDDVDLGHDSAARTFCVACSRLSRDCAIWVQTLILFGVVAGVHDDDWEPIAAISARFTSPVHLLARPIHW